MTLIFMYYTQSLGACLYASVGNGGAKPLTRLDFIGRDDPTTTVLMHKLVTPNQTELFPRMRSGLCTFEVFLRYTILNLIVR